MNFDFKKTHALLQKEQVCIIAMCNKTDKRLCSKQQSTQLSGLEACETLKSVQDTLKEQKTSLNQDDRLLNSSIQEYPKDTSLKEQEKKCKKEIDLLAKMIERIEKTLQLKESVLLQCKATENTQASEKQTVTLSAR